jgi:energy-coupling factor transporter ATP-binding protein EcfA2
MSMTAQADGDHTAADFDITSIVIDEYAEYPPLEGLAEEAAEIEQLLAEFGGTAGRPCPPGRTLHERAVKDRLRDWAGRDIPSSVLVWLGHGASDGTDAWLACFDTPREIQGNGLVPQAVADHIVRDWHRREPDERAWALVIVEACGAGTFVSQLDLLAAQKAHPRRIVMIGVSGDGAGYVGELHKALKRTRDTYENNDERILLNDFVSKLEEFLGDVAQVVGRNVGRHFFYPVRLVRANLSAPVDVYQEWVSFLAELSPDERNHFVPKAHGAGHGEFAWYFVGRAAERKRIATWLRAIPGGMLVVTGSPGCGKSALLGNLIVLANPALRELLVRAGRLAPPDLSELPPDHAFDAVVHLAGMSTSDLVRRLADAANVTLPSPEHVWSEEDMDHLAAGLAGQRFTVLADALDEARDPVAIAGTVLSRIAQIPGGRVIVGTRTASTGEPASGSEPLLNALNAIHSTDVIRISRDPLAIETYARQRLLDARRTQRIDADNEVIEAVARRLGGHGDRGDRQFLFARLAVHELIAQPGLLAPSSRRDLTVLLDGNHRSLFAFAVGRLTKASRTARPLLEALALAQGRGVPRSEGIWAQMATALAGSRIGEREIEDLLAQAGPYIMLDAEYGFSVYRLAHETFRELLHPEATQPGEMGLALSETGGA